MIDITDQQRAMVCKLLQMHLPDTRVWAYGSRVKQSSTPRSDLDLVVFSTLEQRDQVVELQEALDESDLPFRVDLFVWDSMPDEFREEIELDHEELVQSFPKVFAPKTPDLGRFCLFLHDPCCKDFRKTLYESARIV